MGQECEEDEKALEGMEVLGHDAEDDGDVVESAVSDLQHASQTQGSRVVFLERWIVTIRCASLSNKCTIDSYSWKRLNNVSNHNWTDKDYNCDLATSCIHVIMLSAFEVH